MNLDFTISTPEQRINYITPQLPNLNPTQLEYAADYILRADKFPIDAKQSYWQRKQPEAIEDSCLDTTQFQPIARNTYTKPKQKISPTQWQLPALAPLNTDLAILKAKLAQLQPNTAEYSKLRHLIIDIKRQAYILLDMYCKPIPGKHTIPCNTPPIDIEQFIDYTNPFHLKYMYKFYNSLSLSEESKYSIEFLDYVAARTPLTDWQRTLIQCRKLNYTGAQIKQTILALHQRTITDAYISTSWKIILDQIAKSAENIFQEIIWSNSPEKWKKCGTCNHFKVNTEYNFRKKGNTCKLCLNKREKSVEIEETKYRKE